MEQFAVIGLDTQEKKAEAEAILKELGYKGDKDWNDRYRQNPSFQVISRWSSGDYCYYVCAEDNETPITLDELRDKTGKSNPVEKPTYPCMMDVWNSHEEYSFELEVISEVEYNGVKGFLVYNEAYGDFYSYKNARPIQPDPLKEVIEKLKNDSVTLTPNEAQLILDALENPQPK